MPEFLEKTTDQLRAIFGLGRSKDMDKEDLEQLAGEITNARTVRLSKLSFDEANAIIVHLGGEAFPAPGHVAKRTQNYRKQKAGIKTVETQKHERLIRDLADKRNMTTAGLASLCMRVIKRPWPQTTAQGNKIVEALKAMNRRDGILPSKTSGTSSTSQTLRRAA